MQLGISSYTFGWSVNAAEDRHRLDEHALLHLAEGYGVDRLQVGDNLPLHLFSHERLESFRHAVQKSNIVLEIGARKLTKDNLLRYLDLCVAFKSPLLRFVIDDDGYQPGLASVESMLRYFVPELVKRSVVLGIENHDRFKASELAQLVKNCDTEFVGICLDSANSLGAGEGLDHVVNVLAPYTVNVHVKDFSVTRLPHKMGFTVQGTPAGQGMADIGKMLNAVLPFGRCQSATLEQWVVPEKEMDATIKKEKQWADDSILYLQSIPLLKKNKRLNSIL